MMKPSLYTIRMFIVPENGNGVELSITAENILRQDLENPNYGKGIFANALKTMDFMSGVETGGEDIPVERIEDLDDCVETVDIASSPIGYGQVRDENGEIIDGDAGEEKED